MTEPNNNESNDAAPEPAATETGPAGETAISHEERLWATFAHLAAFAGAIIPFLGLILGPLIIWLLKREQMPFVDDQGKEALNFQITVAIGFAICFVLMFVLIGFPLMILLGLFDLVFTIIAAIKANEGERYRYPYALRLIQ